MRRVRGSSGALPLAATLVVGALPISGSAARSAPVVDGASATDAPSPVAAAPVGSPPSESAADEEAARKREALELFEAARLLYLAGEYADAAREFRRSFAAQPSLEALVAAARASAAGGDLFAALDTYAEYLEFEDDDARRHQEALEDYRELRLLVGELALMIEEPETIRAVTLNGEAVDLSEFPRRIMPGPVVLEVLREGDAEPRSIRADVRGGATTMIDVPAPSRPVAPPTGPPEGPPPPEEPRPPGPGLAIAFWTSVGLSGAAGLTIATLGGLTLREKGRFQGGLCPLVDGGGCAEGATYPRAAEERFGALRLATNIVIGVGVGLAITSLALGLTLRQRRRDVARARVGWGPGGLEIGF